MNDDFVADLAGANLDAFLFDLRSGRTELEARKNLEDFRKAQDVEQALGRFEEEVQLAASGRSAPSPRLRSEHREEEPEPTWHVGDDPDEGLGEPFVKRARSKAARVVKNESGTVCEYDAAGSVIRCYGSDVDPSSFDDLDKTCHCGS